MSRLLLLLALALPARAASPDLAAEYKAAKDRRDRAAAELSRQSKELQSSLSDPAARAQAGKAVEAAQLSYKQAQAEFDGVVRKMKPGDLIWVEETKVQSTGDDRYQTRIPSVGEGAAQDPRLVGGNYVGEVPYNDKKLPPMRGLASVGGGPMPVSVPPAGSVGYGRPAGYDNDKLNDIDAAAGMTPAVVPPRTVRRPALPGEPSEAPVEALPEEGVPFQGPIPAAALPTGFVIFPKSDTFPNLLAFDARRPGAGSLKLLRDAGDFIRKGDLPAAWKAAEVLVARHPDDPGVRRLAAILLLRLGRFGEAEKHVAEALRLDPASADAWAVLSWIRLRQGRRAEAADAARWALRLDPSHAGAAAALKASGGSPNAPAPSAQPAPPAAAAPFAAPPQSEPRPSEMSGRGRLAVAAAVAAGAALTFLLKLLVFRRRP